MFSSLYTLPFNIFHLNWVHLTLSISVSTSYKPKVLMIDFSPVITLHHLHILRWLFCFDLHLKLPNSSLLVPWQMVWQMHRFDLSILSLPYKNLLLLCCFSISWPYVEYYLIILVHCSLFSYIGNIHSRHNRTLTKATLERDGTASCLPHSFGAWNCRWHSTNSVFRTILLHRLVTQTATVRTSKWFHPDLGTEWALWGQLTLFIAPLSWVQRASQEIHLLLNTPSDT